MINTQNFLNIQPWIDFFNTTTTKLFELNTKTIENSSKINIGLVSECANIMSKCAQDIGNPKEFAAMPSKMSTEFNNLTQQVVEYNKRSLDAAIATINEYQQFSQKIAKQMTEIMGISTETKTGSASTKKND